jgi:hypothetical protein
MTSNESPKLAKLVCLYPGCDLETSNEAALRHHFGFHTNWPADYRPELDIHLYDPGSSFNLQPDTPCPTTEHVSYQSVSPLSYPTPSLLTFVPNLPAIYGPPSETSMPPVSSSMAAPQPVPSPILSPPGPSTSTLLGLAQPLAHLDASQPYRPVVTTRTSSHGSLDSTSSYATTTSAYSQKSQLNDPTTTTTASSSTGAGSRSQSRLSTQTHGHPRTKSQSTEITPTRPRLPCSYPGCTQTFAHQADMLRHARKHASPKFDCDYPGCPYKGKRGFYRKDKLMSHQRNRHGVP